MEKKVYQVCVVGGGAAGTMAALRTVLNNDECLFFPGSPQDKKRSRALWVRKVENMPAHFGYKRGIEDPNAEAIKWINESAFKDKLQIKKNTGVVKIKKDAGVFELTDSKGETHFAQYVILCTGIMDVQPKISGSIEEVFDYANAQTIDYCLICDGHHVLDKKVSIIGHTDSAAWAAILLHERYHLSECTLITNGEEPRFSDDLNKLISLYKMRVVTAPIKEIRGEEKGKILKGFVLEDANIIESDICFVALGLMAYNDLALQVGAEVDERGLVKADVAGLTNVDNFYVAGDLKANTRKQIYTSWDMAVSSANAINQKIRVARREKLLQGNIL